MSLGTILDYLGKQATAPSSRSAVDQMKIDLAKAEVDHLKALIKIEGRRLAGQKDVKDVITAIQNTLTTCANTNCTFKFTDDQGTDTTQNFPRSEQIDTTLVTLKTSESGKS